MRVVCIRQDKFILSGIFHKTGNVESFVQTKQKISWHQHREPLVSGPGAEISYLESVAQTHIVFF